MWRVRARLPALAPRLSSAGRTVPGFPRPPALRPQWSVTSPQVSLGLRGRRFCAVGVTVEERVIRAVRRYVAERQQERKTEAEESPTTDPQEQKKREEADKLLAAPVTADSTWDSFGFDELDKVEVLLVVEEEFDHVIPDDVADTLSSVKETTEFMTKSVPS